MAQLSDRQLYNILVAININLIQMKTLMEEIKRDGVRVVTQESHA